MQKFACKPIVVCFTSCQRESYRGQAVGINHRMNLLVKRPMTGARPGSCCEHWRRRVDEPAQRRCRSPGLPHHVQQPVSMMRLKTLARREKTKRLRQVVYGPKLSGGSRHGAPRSQDPEDAVEHPMIIHARYARGLFGSTGLTADQPGR